MPTFAERLKQKAREIGFSKIGIVPADKLTEEKGLFFKWLDHGFHGQMEWMNREPSKRVGPKLIFPEAKSVIVVAENYFTDRRHAVSPTSGKISRYAWGDDYHDIVKEKLRELLDWIKTEMPTAEGKICADTSPMLEKAWAVRAGIGWLGKHSNVITTDLGSWVFLGEVLLNIELDYDNAIIPDHCGSCTACLDACPTGAIVEPYVVDSRKCISYATIELRDDELPAEMVPNLEGWLYGCDICQDVCPWNRFETPTDEKRFEPRGRETSLDLNTVSRMEHTDYVERFRRSAMKRTKLTGLKRNARTLQEGSSQ